MKEKGKRPIELAYPEFDDCLTAQDFANAPGMRHPDDLITTKEIPRAVSSEQFMKEANEFAKLLGEDDV